MSFILFFICNNYSDAPPPPVVGGDPGDLVYLQASLPYLDSAAINSQTYIECLVNCGGAIYGGSGLNGNLQSNGGSWNPSSLVSWNGSTQTEECVVTNNQFDVTCLVVGNDGLLYGGTGKGGNLVKLT